MFAIVVILDIFHGKEGTARNFYSTATYCISIILALIWAVMIPFSRYLIGVHSLDQITFGITLGIWGALLLHFLIRDSVMEHMDSILFERPIVESDSLNQSEEKSRTYAIRVFVAFITFETICFITFFIVNSNLSPDSDEVIIWM